MPILTATEVTIYSNISASAATVAASGLIPLVQERIMQILNNEFATDIMVVASATFTAGTITLDANDWSEFGFADGDEIIVKQSYRNDGYYEISSFVGSTATLATGYTTIGELSGRTIIFSMAKWPLQVKRAAALMVAYDYDTRPKVTPGVKSFSLGPFSESYADDKGLGAFGYPQDLLGNLPTPVVNMI